MDEDMMAEGEIKIRRLHGEEVRATTDNKNEAAS